MKRYLCLLVAFVMTFYGIAAYAEQLVVEQEQYSDEMAQEEIEFSQTEVDALNGEEAAEEDCVFLQDSEDCYAHDGDYSTGILENENNTEENNNIDSTGSSAESNTQEDVLEMKVGEKTRIQFDFGKTASKGKVIWSIENKQGGLFGPWTAFATVAKDGTVTALKAGNVTVIARLRQEGEEDIKLTKNVAILESDDHRQEYPDEKLMVLGTINYHRMKAGVHMLMIDYDLCKEAETQTMNWMNGGDISADYWFRAKDIGYTLQYAWQIMNASITLKESNKDFVCSEAYEKVGVAVGSKGLWGYSLALFKPFSENEMTEEQELVDKEEQSLEESKTIYLTFKKNMQKTVFVGEKIQLKTSKKIKKCKSSNPSVASVTKSGLISALKAGKTKITVTLKNKKKLTLTLTVKKPCVKVDNSQLILGVGEQYKVKAKVIDGRTQEVRYFSDNQRIAKIEADGTITAVSVGTAYITVSANGADGVSFPVVVKDAPDSLSFSADSLTIKVGERKKITPVLPNDCAGNVSYKSDNESVAVVDSNGVVVGISEGVTRIEGTTYNGIKGYATVNVEKFSITIRLMGNAGVNRITSVTYDHNLDEIIKRASSTVYDPELASMLIALSGAAYEPSFIEDAYRGLGFVDEHSSKTYQLSNYGSENEKLAAYGLHNVAVTVGERPLIGASNGEKLILIVVRGSHNTYDWVSNVSIDYTGKPGRHTGFALAASKVYDRVVEYLGDMPTKNVKYVVTGHSRGAAVANLVTRLLHEKGGVPNDAIYNYNYACPDVAKLSATTNWRKGCENSFNVCNTADLVAFVPGILGDMIGDSIGLLIYRHTGLTLAKVSTSIWGKYGTTYYFNRGWDDRDEYRLILKTIIEHQAKNTQTSSHDPSYYMSYLNEMHPSSSYKSYAEVMAHREALGIDPLEYVTELINLLN